MGSAMEPLENRVSKEGKQEKAKATSYESTKPRGRNGEIV